MSRVPPSVKERKEPSGENKNHDAEEEEDEEEEEEVKYPSVLSPRPQPLNVVNSGELFQRLLNQRYFNTSSIFLLFCFGVCCFGLCCLVLYSSRLVYLLAKPNHVIWLNFNFKREQDLLEAFALLDKEHSGKMDISDLVELLRDQMGLNPQRSDIQQALGSLHNIIFNI